MKLGTLVASTSCLATAMATNNNEEASAMIDFIAGLGIKEKHLLIDMPVVMNTELLSNKSINFDVIMIQKINDSGKYVRKLIKEFEFHGYCTRTICFDQVFFQESKIHVKSLCPSLGETYPKLYDGTCPELLQSIHGKNISITFIGTEPYIDDDDFEIEHNSIDSYFGSEFLVLKALMDKFKFLPNFIAETKSFDNMMHKV